MVSKPLVPPWNDSAKNLVRDLAVHLQRTTAHLLTTPGVEPLAPHCTMEPIYQGAGRLAPGLAQQIRVLKRLAQRDQIPLYHFFFAPNPKTSLAARGIFRFKKRRTLQTIASAPLGPVGPLLFADHQVVLSRHTLTQLRNEGIQGVTHIPPCIPDTPPVSLERKETARAASGLPREPFVLFAGDYEFSNAAQMCMDIIPDLLRKSDAHFVFAVRAKGPRSLAVEASLKKEAAERGFQRVHFLGEVEDMEALIASATLQVLPADTLYAKMDYPLVLLESLREGVPIVVSDFGPLPELVEDPVGLSTPTGDASALSSAVLGLLKNERTRRDMGLAGQQAAREKYTPQAMATQYEELYDKLL